MRKGKIITASALLGLTISASVLSGCSLVTTDYSQYYKAIVAETTTESGKKIEINKKELLTAYSNYGYQYASYYGMTTEQAIKTTIEQIISNKLIVEKVENYLQTQNGQVLSSKEKAYLWEKTYDSFISNLKEEKEEENEESNSGSKITKRTYEKQAELIVNTLPNGDTEYKIRPTATSQNTIDTYTRWSEGEKDATTQAGKEEIFNMIGNFVVENKDYAKAYSVYLSTLKQNEKGQNLSTDNKSVLIREIERLYGVNYDSYMSTRYEEIFKSKDMNISVQDVLSIYKDNVLEDYTKYALEGSAKFSEDILNSADGMYYVDDSADFFYVTHILVKFTDEQAALLKTYQAVLDGTGTGKYTIQQAEQGIEDLYGSLLAMERTEGEKGEMIEDKETSKKTETAQSILEKVQSATSSGDAYIKAENFYDLMCAHTEDDGTIGQTYNYVIGVDYETPTRDEEDNVTKPYTVYSKMVEPFTDAAIELYNHGNGQIGDVSGLVRSEYGVHILMYAGQVENLCDNIDLNLQIADNEILKLYETRLTPCVDYTYFDLIYEKIEKDDFSKYKAQDVNYMKSKMTNYKLYQNAYKDLI